MSDNEEHAPDGASRTTAQLASFARLGVLIAASIGLAWIFHGFSVLVVVLALVLMVMGHELGHFLAAKVSGMKVTEYFLGFGPRIWSMRRGETEYGVKLLPVGGYVRIVGMNGVEEVDPVDEPRSYRAATFPRRLLVAVAGSAMHVVMAFVLLWSMFAIVGEPTPVAAKIASVSSFVGARSPAQIAGIHAGDEFVSIDGHHFADPNGFVDYITAHPNEPLHVVVLRHGRDVALTVTPANRSKVRVVTPTGSERLAPAGAKPSGVIGVEINFVMRNEATNPLNAIVRSGSMLQSMTSATFAGIAAVFSVHGLTSFAHNVATANQRPATTSGGGSSNGGQLLSIYGAVQVGAQAEQQNLALLIELLVGINLFVGLINLFPMLPLDGGHVVVAVYERIRSRRGHRYHADVTKLMPVIALFVAFMVVLGVAALYANIVQPVTLPGR